MAGSVSGLGTGLLCVDDGCIWSVYLSCTHDERTS